MTALKIEISALCTKITFCGPRRGQFSTILSAASDRFESDLYSVSGMLKEDDTLQKTVDPALFTASFLFATSLSTSLVCFAFLRPELPREPSPGHCIQRVHFVVNDDLLGIWVQTDIDDSNLRQFPDKEAYNGKDRTLLPFCFMKLAQEMSSRRTALWCGTIGSRKSENLCMPTQHESSEFDGFGAAPRRDEEY